MNTASILGVQFHAVTKQQAVELAMSKIRSRQKGYVVTPNPEIVDLCRHDEKVHGRCQPCDACPAGRHRHHLCCEDPR